ncbi:flagellar hook-basal body complex protein [Rhodovulum adriaticum]|uniref:Flagellar basal-body rod protein FlgF n=1 Tax=Rhodovulum adriaticum TaxID=35804 RepID=A0A4R2NZB7_RHOAD|nr:flagellar hook-basal body complex protein [Rhodovulum adriaticum]MBK1634766.1 flagellar biosynthesis protein FlgF [Rhodovulum adriaticum]TCP27659.1 flagellar basal-body rod protein FlgF [Rhodovulum adriaticum]
MEVAAYAALARQTGLMREMDTIAQNIANAATTGYRAEGLVFAEHVARLGNGGGGLSMGHAIVRNVDLSQAPLARTGGQFDFAIQGTGFFLLDTPDGPRLTRAGSFTPNAVGELVSPDGHRLLDAGGAPVFVPPDAHVVALATDGTLSADGRPLTRIGLYAPADPAQMTRAGSALFDPGGAPLPVEGGQLVQGVLEQSNVDPMTQIARMIEVQRAYSAGQDLVEKEDDRIRQAIRTLGPK